MLFPINFLQRINFCEKISVSRILLKKNAVFRPKTAYFSAHFPDLFIGRRLFKNTFIFWTELITRTLWKTESIFWTESSGGALRKTESIFWTGLSDRRLRKFKTFFSTARSESLCWKFKTFFLATKSEKMKNKNDVFSPKTHIFSNTFERSWNFSRFFKSLKLFLIFLYLLLQSWLILHIF